MTATKTLNAQLNGVELSFTEKPSSAIIEALKAAGYRWHNVKKLWYAKQNVKTLTIADTLSGSRPETVTADKQTNTKTENTKTAYYPAYDHVGDEEIFRSSDIDIIDHNRMSGHGGYFADINAHIHIFWGQVYITDLTNALTPGKTCKSISVNVSTNNDDIRCKCANKYKTFKKMYEDLFINRNFDNYTVYDSEQKAINTFTPFKEIQPIKKPEKWTTAHIWKAILSGQIYKGTKDGHYTDDYAYDAAVNFGTGRGLNLVKMAKDLIESPSGWWVSVDKSEGNKAVLSFNCHSFDSNTLYFDESCNQAEAQRRASTEEAERENYNNSMLAQVQDIKTEDIQPEAVYTIKYLDMNDNTKKYEVKSENVQGSQLFYTETVYPVDGDEYEKTESKYDIISLEEMQISDSALFEVSNFHDRPYFEEDSRIINLGNWENIVTGKALKELIQDGYNFPCVKEYKQTPDGVKENLRGHITGRIRYLFSEDKTDYKEAYNRFESELMRV